LYRPEYYGITEDENGQPTHGLGEIIIAKHRNGSLDTAHLKFIGKYTKFTDLDFNFRPSGYDLPSTTGLGDFTSSGTITLSSKSNPKEAGDQSPEDPDVVPF
jgi:replicative DNA helicase